MKNIVLILTWVVLVVGCAAEPAVVIPGRTVSARLSGGPLGIYLAQNKLLLSNLAANDVQIRRQGDSLTLILPAARFFIQGSTTLDKTYYPVLADVARLLTGLENTGIKVAAYTDSTQPPVHSVALTRQQAEAIANYLWRSGVDARLLTAVGYGEQMPIANNNTKSGQAMNRRVEISTWLVTAPDDL